MGIECVAIASSTPSSSPTPVPSGLPTPTTSPVPTNAGTPRAHSDDAYWHAPGSHGDRPAHEHGDQAPQWVYDAGYEPLFDHHANTLNENLAYWKHTGFKGWAGEFNGVKWYGIFHLDFNPAGHVNRFHSYQLWMKDASGAVSHIHGWLDFGSENNTGPNLSVRCVNELDVRPIISVNSVRCPVEFESWYGKGGVGWTPDIGFNINPNYYAGGDINNPATWTSINGNVNSTERRIELSWYAFRSEQRGRFYATQFGDIVSGPNDPICGTQRQIGERIYPILCLEEYIAPTLTTIGFPGNNIQRRFPGSNLVLPN